MASGDSSNGGASLKREGTMQRTVREAKDNAYGCNCGEMEGEHDHDQETGQPIKPTRMSSMEKTAQEGIQFLKDQRKDTLLEAQGLVTKPRSKRNENDDDEDDDEDDEDDDTEDHTEGADDDDDDEPLTGENGDSNSNGGPVKMAKHGTMLATAKEGQNLLDNYMGGAVDPNARTRAQQKAYEEDEEDDDEDDGPDAKRPRRTQTMQDAAQAAQNFVADPHSMGGTRSETAAVKKAEQEGSPKRQRKQ